MGNFSFIHMADPQFGLFADSSGKSPEEIASFAARGLMVRPAAKFDGLGPETELFTKAIAAANTLAPKFVVVCGDIVNSAGNRDQIRTAKRIADELDNGIDLHWVAGN